MPVRNALPYLDLAVESILGQSFADFEFVIRDDDSTDGSRERLRYWAAKDSRIRLFEGERSLGPAGSSNWVVAQARAPVVARMDADDVSLPGRLDREYQILENDRDAVLVGSVWEGIDRQGRVVREPDLSVIGANGFAAPFAHGSIMFRRDAFERAGGYRAECNFWEDLDLYVRMASFGRVLVTAEPLYRHRFSETSTRLTSHRTEVEASVDRMFRCRSAYERGEDYGPLLRADDGPDRDAKRDPNTFLSLGFITLWSGLRPPTLGQLLRRGALRPDLKSARALVWALWATASPRSLRYLMRVRLRLKSEEAKKRFGGRTLWEWQVARNPAPGVGAASSSGA